jgi:hypothetical protein
MLDTLSFPRFDIWRRNHWSARSRPFVPEYCVVARLKIVDRDFWIEGAVLQLSQDGALFREASSYVLKRQNEEIVLEMESGEYPGQLVMTNKLGYRIEFFEPLAENHVAELRERWRIDG